MEFKQIDDLNYEVSVEGVIRNRTTKRIIKSNPGGTSPYLVSMLCLGNKKYTSFLVHRAIAKAYIPNPENKAQINHKDGNKLNNSIGNLEWVTKGENLKHAYDTGLRKYRPLHYKGKFGKDHNRSIGVRCIETGEEFGSMSEAGRKLNIDHSSVSWSIKHKAPIYGMTFERIAV